MLSWKSLRPHIAIAFVALCATLFLLPQLPAQIPIHWNIQGEVDKVGGRLSALMIPLLMFGLILLSWLLPRIDPRRENYARFGDSYVRMMLVLQFFFAAFHALTMMETLRPGSLAINTVMPVCMGLLFALMGNLMPKLKHNYFAGIRTPWTLNDEDNWYATHRFGGKVWFVAGLLAVASAFLPGVHGLTVFFILVVLMAALPFAYSYWWFVKSKS